MMEGYPNSRFEKKAVKKAFLFQVEGNEKGQIEASHESSRVSAG
jgi:hypothetical protein